MYEPSETRYETMPYNRCGKSGLRLPALSVGLWQNFGLEKSLEEQEAEQRLRYHERDHSNGL